MPTHPRQPVPAPQRQPRRNQPRREQSWEPCHEHPAIIDRPLPDLTAVRLAAVPDSAPPYDRELPADAPSDSAPADKPIPRQPAPRQAVLGRSVPGRGAVTPELPGRFAQVMAETLAGSRPARQADSWTTESTRKRIRQLGPLLAVGQQPRIQRVVTFRPAADVMEVAAVVGFGARTRALAMRFEHEAARPALPGRPAKAARWLCTAIEAA